MRPIICTFVCLFVCACLGACIKEMQSMTIKEMQSMTSKMQSMIIKESMTSKMQKQIIIIPTNKGCHLPQQKKSVVATHAKFIIKFIMMSTRPAFRWQT
jgi:hypothetical protein